MLCIVISMKKQNQIKRTLSRPEAIKYVSSILAADDDINRTKLADHLCEHFSFFDLLGKKQRSGCLKAIRELEKAGHFVLPPAQYTKGNGNLRRLTETIPEPEKIPDNVGKINKLRLIAVKTKEQRQIWNELMIQDHPRGAGPLVGRQIYYLVQSEHGWLGGLGFSSAAIHLSDRDHWIGWTWEERQANLHHIVNLSRFLIRSSVRCKNLASHILGLSIRKFPIDFEDRYGHRPVLLESFVDIDHYTGACYKAANWQWVGKTKGIGRQGIPGQGVESVKDIYVFPLEKDFRTQMGLPDESGLGPLEILAGIDSEKWSEKEFGNAPLGDQRLSQRLVEIGSEKGDKPGRAYCGVTEGDWAKAKAYYRFVDKPDDSAVNMPNILLPHRERTIRRMKAQKTVLCIQDGSDLNYSSLDQCKDLGIIGSNQTSAKSRGLHLHSTLAVTTEGLPLGVLKAECSAPKQKTKAGKKLRASNTPIEEKKTFCWIEGVRDCMFLKDQMPHTRLVNISDREADFFEMFDDQRINSHRVELLVRAKYNRKTTGGNKLFETVRESQIKTELKIKVLRQSARAKKSKQKARPKQLARTAEVVVRYEKVEIAPPIDYKSVDSIPIWIVHLKEEAPPVGTKPLEWFLLTTIDIKTTKNALKCIEWYCLRWRIEDWHRVLKSGCRVEKIAHKTAERLKRAIAINLVIAWRIMLMTLMGREVPELPSDVLFSDLEIEVLKAYAKKRS